MDCNENFGRVKSQEPEARIRALATRRLTKGGDPPKAPALFEWLLASHIPSSAGMLSKAITKARRALSGQFLKYGDVYASRFGREKQAGLQGSKRGVRPQPEEKRREQRKTATEDTESTELQNAAATPGVRPFLLPRQGLPAAIVLVRIPQESAHRSHVLDGLKCTRVFLRNPAQDGATRSVGPWPGSRNGLTPSRHIDSVCFRAFPWRFGIFSACSADALRLCDDKRHRIYEIEHLGGLCLLPVNRSSKTGFRLLASGSWLLTKTEFRLRCA